MRGILFLILLTVAHGAWAGGELSFYNWSDYLPVEVLEQFTAETGIRVRHSTYDSNEAMYAKLKLLQGKGYDVAVPSTYYVDRMRREGLLLPLDRKQLPNFRNLDARHLNKSFDPDNRFSIPYFWGSTGIIVDTRQFNPTQVQAWGDLWRPELRNRLLLSNDMREVFFIGLRTLGYSGNSANPEQIRQAYEKLRSLMPNIRVFNSDAPQILYITGEVDAGMLWNGNAVRAQRENPNLRYIYPREGCSLWMDNLVIPIGSEHTAEAHRFIDFLLRPDIARYIAETLVYASPNAEAVKALPASLRNNPVIYPPEELIRNGEYAVDIGDAITIYAKYWERLKAGE